MDTRLIGFRAPSSDYKIHCTSQTLARIDEVTYLAKITDHIDISSAPNIWSTREGNSSSYRCPSTSPYSTLTLMSLGCDGSNSSTSTEDETIPEQIAIFPRSSGGSFDVDPGSRFFVIKSFSESDVEASRVHGIWTSTELGNQRLNNAFHQSCKSSVFLLFLVNGSSKFCGIARMTGPVDFTKVSDIWVEAARWKGIFPLEWLVVKEVPNSAFRYLKVPTNCNKCVTNSRDTQELPLNVGVAMLKIFTSFRHPTQ